MRLLFGSDILLVLAYLLISLVMFCFLYGGLTNNVSQVDRLWSILPIFTSWMFAYVGEFSPVVVLMAFVVTLWGARLTYNFYVRGGYAMKNWVFTDEDYRWGVMRKAIPNSVCWDCFHLFFICFFQITLIIGFTTPILLVAESDANSKPLSMYDLGFAALFLFFLAIETIADATMNRFQAAKYALSPEERAKSDDLRIVAGFNFTGLCKYSRHPNYFSEVMQWVVLYCWGSYRIGAWKNWSLPFVVILAILVFSSTFICEPVSSSKYPLYKEYQKVTSRFIPFIPIHYKRFVTMVKKSEWCVCLSSVLPCSRGGLVNGEAC